MILPRFAFVPRSLLWTLLGLLALAFLPRLAWANAAPPTEFRFEFVYETAEPVTLEGMQLLSCEGSDTCEHPRLIATYGQCEEPPCLAGAPEDPPAVSILCEAEGCIADVGFENDSGPYRALFQFSDGTRTTPTLGTPIPYRVMVQEDGLGLRSLYWEPYGFLVPLLFFVPAFLFTLAVESLVAWLFLRALQKPARDLLLWLIPLHLATVPVVWFLFPALRWDADRLTQQLAVVTVGLLILVALGAWLYRRGNPSSRVRLTFIVLILLVLPALCTLGASPLPGAGLMVALTTLTLLAEVFIFLFETVFLRTVSRGSLSFAQAAGLSLLANLASYGGGELAQRLLA